MNVKSSVFVICLETIIYLLLYNLHDFTFNIHIDKLCRNAQNKLHALKQKRKFLNLQKAKPFGNASINCLYQFNYAPLIWMFCRKRLYLKMQKIHHKTMKVISQSNKTYEQLLELSETSQYSSTTLKIFSF